MWFVASKQMCLPFLPAAPWAVLGHELIVEIETNRTILGIMPSATWKPLGADAAPGLPFL